MSPSDLLREWVLQHRFSFEALEDGGAELGKVTLIEKTTKKSLSLRWGELARIEEARDNYTSGRYLRLFLEDGRAFALATPGFVFAPSFVNTGLVADCPPTACFADFERIFKHLVHVIDDEAEDYAREALQMMMVLIAFLDGARAIGLDVGPEEGRLNIELERLEQRGVVPK